MSSLIRWRSSSAPALFLGIRPSWRVERRLYTSCSKLDCGGQTHSLAAVEIRSEPWAAPADTHQLPELSSTQVDLPALGSAGHALLIGHVL